MPKIRGVKPEYWTDEDIVELSIPARLLFIGLWNFACDNGHIADKPKQIKMRILPGDDVDVHELLSELVEHGRIVRERGTITILKFAHHQKPHSRWWSTCNLPGCLPPGAASTVAQPPPKDPHNGGTTVVNGDPRRTTAVVDGDVEGDGDGEQRRVTDPPAASTSLVLVDDDRPDVDRICNALAQAIEDRGAKRPGVTARWRNEARLLLDRDRRTEAQVHACIAWLFTSTHRDAMFWRTNIRSMPKLRAEYDRLRELAERPTVSRAGDQQALLDRAMARAEARERSGT